MNDDLKPMIEIILRHCIEKEGLRIESSSKTCSGHGEYFPYQITKRNLGKIDWGGDDIEKILNEKEI